MIKVYPQNLFALAILVVLGATGCPSSENNIAENNRSDAGIDAKFDTAADLVTADTISDTGVETTGCVVLNAFPRTLPLGGDPARITWTLACDEPIEPAALELIAPRELTMELEIPNEGICKPDVDKHICTFSASGLIAPTPETAVRSELFEVIYGPEKRLTTDVHWHFTADALNTEFAQPLIELDDAHVTGGLGVAFYKTRRPFKVRLRAAYKEQLRRTEMSIVPPDGGTSTTTVEVAAVWEDLLGQNTEIIENSNGSGEMLWWGYDGRNKTFIGAALGSDQDGNETYQEVYSPMTLEGGTEPEIILDARAVRIPRPATATTEASAGVNVFVMGLNADGNLVFHIPFGSEGTAREFAKGTFFGLDESKLSSKTLGFVKQLGNVDDYYRNANDNYFLVWSALPNATNDKLNITILPSYTASAPVAVATELDTGFEVTDTYVSQSAPGSIIVLAHGADNARAMYRLTYETTTDPETGDEVGAVTSHVQLELPANVDVRPSPCHTPKKDTPKKDDSWECMDPVLSCDGDGELCGVTDHFRTLGRWPWNWRDLKDTRSQSQHSMVLDWNDDGTLNSVFPLVLDSATKDYVEGAPVIISEHAGGRALGVHTTSFSAEACANPEDCFIRVADSLLMGPGTNAPTFYIEGEDDVKKVNEAHKIESNRAFAHFGRKRTKSKRVIAPVVPGTSDVATHVLMDLGTTPGGSDTANSVLLNITVNDKPIDPNLAMQGVVSHLVGETEELVMIFQPLTVAEGDTPKATVLSISGDEIDAALASPDKVATINTLGAPLEFVCCEDGFGISSIQISIRSTRTAAPSGANSITNTLDQTDAERILVIYPSSTNGELVVGGLSKKGTSYVHTELPLALSPAGTEAPRKLVQNTARSGSDELMFSANKTEAFFTRRRQLSTGLSVLDVVTRSYAAPLSDLSFEAVTYETGDFNADGIEDLYVSTDFSKLPPSTVLSSEDMACAGCLVYFGDGLGGFLETPMNVVGGPQGEWSVSGRRGRRGIRTHGRIRAAVVCSTSHL